MRVARKGLIKAFVLSAALTLSAALFIFSSSLAWFYMDAKTPVDLGLNPEIFAVEITTEEITKDIMATANYRMKMSTVLAKAGQEPYKDDTKTIKYTDFIDPYFNMAVMATYVTVTNTGTFSIYAGITVEIAIDGNGVPVNSNDVTPSDYVPVNDKDWGLKCAVVDLDQIDQDLVTTEDADEGAAASRKDLVLDVYGHRNFKSAIYSAVERTKDPADESGQTLLYPGGYDYAEQNDQLNTLNISMERRLLAPPPEEDDDDQTANNSFYFIMVFWIDAMDSIGGEIYSGADLTLHEYSININVIAYDTNKPLDSY